MPLPRRPRVPITRAKVMMDMLIGETPYEKKQRPKNREARCPPMARECTSSATAASHSGPGRNSQPSSTTNASRTHDSSRT